MEKRRLGTSDVKITPILMGTWQAGKKAWVGVEDADSIKAIRAAFGPGHKFDPEDNRAKNKLFQGENFERAQQALEKLRPISDRHHCTLAQLALAWLIAQPQTSAIAPKGRAVCAIAGARHPEQATANAQAASVQLSTEELQEIDAIGRIVTDHLDDGSVM